jgi:hypothetical protein
MEFDYNKIKANIHDGIYTYIGSGSGRQVYDIGNGYVAKMAKNCRGYAQNEVEYHISLIDSSGLFASIVDAKPDLTILIMEKADRLNHLSAVWKYYHVKNNRQLYLIPQIRKAMIQHKLEFADMCRVQNWGMIGGKPVIIDYGFTKSVHRKYYKH